MNIKSLRELSKILEYKIIKDEFLNEYVLLKKSDLVTVKNIDDKTAFEAMENHIHLLDYVHKKDIQELVEISNVIGNTVLSRLNSCFPNKKFIVYISIQMNDSMIIRFHQKWENELPYYDVRNLKFHNEFVFAFE